MSIWKWTWSRDRVVTVAALTLAAAAIAVPAWADSEGDSDGVEPPAPPPRGEAEVAPAPPPGGDFAVPFPLPRDEDFSDDPLGRCLARHGAFVPPPPPDDEDREAMEREEFDEALERAAQACGAPDRGVPDPFPLSDSEIQAHREALEEYVRCMRAHGQELGEPEVGPDRMAIPIGPGAFTEAWLEAERECGGPLPLDVED